LEAVGIRPTFIGVDRLADRRSVRRITDVIRQSDCDVVHAHLGLSSTLVPLAARLAGRPSVCTLHSLPQQSGGRDTIKERLCVEVAERSKALIFVFEAAKIAFARRYQPFSGP